MSTPRRLGHFKCKGTCINEHDAFPPKFQVEVQYQTVLCIWYICYHGLGSLISQLKLFSESSQKPVGVKDLRFCGWRLRPSILCRVLTRGLS